MIDAAIPWAALVAGITACVAIAKFWMDRGAAELTAESAKIAALALGARVEVLGHALTDFKVEEANRYATGNALESAEKNMTEAMNGVRDEVRGLNQRLDRIIEAMIPK
jgi:hypothetical protein